MHDPSMRVLTVLELLQHKERVSGPELAERLEVSIRSVQRYIARLQDLGFPVESIRGVGGFYRLKAGFRLPPMIFSPEEALALVLGLEALEHLGLSAFAGSRQVAKSKLERVLPSATTSQVQAIQKVLKMQAPNWLVSVSTEHLIALAEAVHTAQAVHLSYVSLELKSTEREIEPYAVLYHLHRWYLLGYCCSRQAVRVFRVDRIRVIKQLERHFVIPKDFDAQSYLLQSLAFAPSGWQIEVWLNLPMSEVNWILYDQPVLLEPDGTGTLLHCSSDNLEWFASLLLKLQCEFLIHQPKELVVALEAVAMRALRYVQHHL